MKFSILQLSLITGLMALGIYLAVTALIGLDTTNSEANSERAMKQRALPILSEVINLKQVSLESPGTIPVDIYLGQLGPVFVDDNLLYRFVFRPTMNQPVSLPEGVTAAWSGLLVSSDAGRSWQKSLETEAITDEVGDSISYNPVGLYRSAGVLYLDSANARGAGSGEGELIRYFYSRDDLAWQRLSGCAYLVPENYYQLSEGENTYKVTNPNQAVGEQC